MGEGHPWLVIYTNLDLEVIKVTTISLDLGKITIRIDEGPITVFRAYLEPLGVARGA